MKNYSLTAYASTGFPKFWENYKTLALARSTARQALKDGYNMIEIKLELPNKAGYFGALRELVEVVQA